MNTLAKCQVRNNAMYADSLAMSRENIGINSEVLAHSRDANRIMLTRFQLEHAPLVSVLEGLLELVAVERIKDVESQKVVDEAKRIIGLMKVKS